jgi:hypothetical protein
VVELVETTVAHIRRNPVVELVEPPPVQYAGSISGVKIEAGDE